MLVLESTEEKKLSVGVVGKPYDKKLSPGYRGTVGFHTDLRIFDSEQQSYLGGHEATGIYDT